MRADALRNRAQAGGAMIRGVHRRDHGEQDLGGADIARRLLAADVLLAGLQCEAVRLAARAVHRQADDAPGERALELVQQGMTWALPNLTLGAMVIVPVWFAVYLFRPPGPRSQ